VKNSWPLVRYITKVKNLEEGISSSDEKRLGDDLLRKL
jgi:hypothetical protein